MRVTATRMIIALKRTSPISALGLITSFDTYDLAGRKVQAHALTVVIYMPLQLALTLPLGFADIVAKAEKYGVGMDYVAVPTKVNASVM